MSFQAARIFDVVWERKICHAEERLKVLIDDFYLVREDIVLVHFLPILEGRDLEARDLEERELRAILHSWSSQARRKSGCTHGSRRRTNG